MEILKTINENRGKILISTLTAVFIIIWLGCIFLPDIFYDQWIWKYYWGPIVADATPGTSIAWHNGVMAEEGYTIMSELTYGIILAISLYGIYVMIKKLGITINWRFAIALIPYIIFGPVSRSLEDTGYFTEPFVYWYISPLIYVQIAFFAIFFMILGYFLEKRFKKQNVTVNKILFIGGLSFLLPSLILIGEWISGNQWGFSNGVRFDVFLLVISLTSLIVAMVYFIARYSEKYNKNLAVYTNPLNLSMLVGHLIDGMTSYISIKDPLNMGLYYSEKHPASNFLLDIWGPLFPITKFILIMLVIYVFDVYLKDELKNHINLVNLLKICILILGFSPGLRDLLRVTMGV